MPASNRVKTTDSSLPNPSFSATTGRFSVQPQFCAWCPKQYASKPKLLQHQRKKHPEELAREQLLNNSNKVRKSSECKSNVSTATTVTTIVSTEAAAAAAAVGNINAELVLGNKNVEMGTASNAPSSMLPFLAQEPIPLIKTEEIDSDEVDDLTGASNLDNVYLHSHVRNGDIFIDGHNNNNNNGYGNLKTMASGADDYYLHNTNEHNGNNGNESHEANHFQIDSIENYYSMMSDHQDTNGNFGNSVLISKLTINQNNQPLTI